MVPSLSGGRHSIIVSYMKPKLVDTFVCWNLTQLQLYFFTLVFLQRNMFINHCNDVTMDYDAVLLK